MLQVGDLKRVGKRDGVVLVEGGHFPGFLNRLVSPGDQVFESHIDARQLRGHVWPPFLRGTPGAAELARAARKFAFGKIRERSRAPLRVAAKRSR